MTKTSSRQQKTQPLPLQERCTGFSLSKVGKIFHNLVFYSFLVGLGFGLGIISYNLQRYHNRLGISNIGLMVQKSLSLSGKGAPASASNSSSLLRAPASIYPPPSPSELSTPPSASDLSKKQVETGAGSVWHNMSDEELLSRASMGPRIAEVSSKRKPKVAFMFLVKAGLPLAQLWEKFFHGHGGLYSIYIHTSNQRYVDTTHRTSVFYDRRIPSKEVKWGENSMIEAERRLLANALLDHANQRFVLLSESDIPLFNFTTIYNYLMHAQHSFIEVYDRPGRGGRDRYNIGMLPIISPSQWRKGSQWFEMDRDLAFEVVSDKKYFPLFQMVCKSACYSDEHYLPTLVSIRFQERNANRSVTWADWSKGGIHPFKYIRPMVGVKLLERLRESDGETCEYNGETTSICYLFARKFDPKSLHRLLVHAPKVMHF